MEAVERGDEPGILIKLAEKYDIAPCLLAKLVLQKHYRNADSNETTLLVDVKKYVKDTTLIENMDIAYEVYLVRVVKHNHVS